MPPTDDWTIGRLLVWTTDYLKERGCENPRLDAEVLLAKARGCQRIELYTAYHEPAGDEERSAFRELVRRRAEGVPVAHLVGSREFYSLSFVVTPNVLIPRPETELVVATLLDRIRELPRDRRGVEIADVGVGCGVIAVCAARYAPDCRVLATDISREALEVARENAQRHGVADRIELALGDLLTPAPAERSFDFVVSNPPYVSDREWSECPTEVRDHEPRIALAGGPAGMDVIERLAPQASQRLRVGGWLILEISPMIEKAVHACLAALGSFDSMETAKDLAGLPRVVRARRTAAAE